ncbi:MAG: fibronectin type III domain-containing protein [Flavobacteriales bacterium]|nr:fibronectin type III domain-containing protein [Flavobacteriales bacterium]
MKKIRCSLAYHRMPIGSFGDFAGGVRDGIYGNATEFDTPPLDQAAYQSILSDYLNKRYAYKQGGNAQIGPYQAALEKLLSTLDSLAEYVDSVASEDENIILLSGFVPTKASNSKVPKPGQATGVTITRGSTGVLRAECDNQNVGIYYGCIVTMGAPLPTSMYIDKYGQFRVLVNETDDAPAQVLLGSIIDLNMNRRKEFSGLTPGVTYYFAFYVVNAQGVGSLSTPASLMCG